MDKHINSTNEERDRGNTEGRRLCLSYRKRSYTARDAAHKRMYEILQEGGETSN